ncbi:hypothetical protein DFH94DRAFT_817779 [Russula ochroleuca]|uniref:Uncharacterized protein n=1 Tax=Russula ochroleuca TaxID=152965 RepID=A0A9P5MPC5_9AGAM|nr:hypothetical protein DFH94DRAFT_829571 [Russula ochroleuca]KAF8466790.1 hypothetical protein DFH94DRAFT_817779 [Russula ochroleuca]
MTINDDISALVGFICEAFFYGCYTLLFVIAVYLNPNGPNRWPRVKRPVFILSMFMYLFCSIHFALQFNHFYEALNARGVKGFANVTSTVIAAGIDMTLADFTGELIFIYRCWVLWSENYWVIIVPTLGAISGIVSIAEVVHLVIHTHETSPTLPASVVRWNSVVFIAKVCANLMVTVLIVVRMWYLSPRKRRDFLGANLSTGTGWAAIVIVIESGVLYLVAQIIPLILYAIRHPALGLVSSMSVQIYGIASILIFVRMSYLLNSPPERIHREALSTPPRPVSNKLGSGHCTTTSKGSTVLVTANMSTSDLKWKSGSGDLGSNIDSVDNVTTV